MVSKFVLAVCILAIVGLAMMPVVEGSCKGNLTACLRRMPSNCAGLNTYPKKRWTKLYRQECKIDEKTKGQRDCCVDEQYCEWTKCLTPKPPLQHQCGDSSRVHETKACTTLWQKKGHKFCCRPKYL